MADIFLILILLTLVCFAVYLRGIQFSTKNMPPGPPVLPVFGNSLSFYILRPVFNLRDFLSCKTWEYFHLGYKKYGPVFSVQCGKFTGVVFADYDVLKEVESLNEYSMKVSNELTTVRTYGKELGLVFASTPRMWSEMRKFSQRTLRDFGFGKAHTMQSIIEMEITETVKEFKAAEAEKSGVLSIRTNFILSVLNILWCMIAGQRYAHDDPKLKEMLDKNFSMTKNLTFVDPLILAFPVLRKLFPSLFRWSETLRAFEETHEYAQSLINERRAEGSYLQGPQNYIDCFLKKIDEDQNVPDTVYTDLNLQIMIEDFMQTGSTTSVGTLNYAILFLILYPEVQKRCQSEIDAIVVKKDMVPTMEDIEKMPFFQATILEIHRLSCVVPIPVPRICPKDWSFRGWIIPKGTIILSNHYSVMMDEDVWGDPRSFRPDRFMMADGSFYPDKRVVHFGFGKRYCVGATLANSVIPIFIATLLQNFDFRTVPGQSQPNTDPEVGVSLSPKTFQCQVRSRV